MILNNKNYFLVFLFLFVIFKNQAINAEEVKTKLIYYSFNNGALKISKIKENYPAYNSGFQLDDIILKIDDLNLYTNWQREHLRDFLAELNKKKNEEISITVLRKNKTIKLNVKPKLISSNQFGIGVSFFGKECERERSKENNTKFIHYNKDITYIECQHNINLKKDVYLKNLNKKSDDYDYLYYEKISVKNSLARNFLEIKSIFDIKKAEKNYIDAFNLSKKISKERISDYGFQDSYRPAFFAYQLGVLYSNYHISSRSYITYEDYIDYPKAVKWLIVASKDNHRMAMHKLGLIYFNGQPGVSKNQKKSFNFISKATRLGFGSGSYELAHFHLFGFGGVKKNYSRSLLHFKLANTTNSASADFYNIYLLYKYGRLPNDTLEYYAWLVKELSHSKSISAIEKTADFAFQYLDNYQESFKWYTICSKQDLSKSWFRNLRAPLGRSWMKDRLHKRCLAKTILLKKLYLDKKEITKGEIFSTQWINNYIE
jgi:TPR repeat protein